MHKRDRLLQLFVKWGIHEDFPRLGERLATEDVTITHLRRTIQLAEILDDDHRKKKIPEIPKPGEEPTGTSDEKIAIKTAIETDYPKKSLLKNPRQYFKNKILESIKK